MKMKKIITAVLAVMLLVSMLSFEVSASLAPIYIETEDGKITTEIDYSATVLQYLTKDNEFKTDKEKLATMTLQYEKNGYQLWSDEYTGEVATVNLATGQILFTNPSDIASTDAAHSNSTRYQLMSQIIVRYTDNGNEKYFYSFEQAAMNGQITVKNIKNGIRVEYTIGREETKYLVPRFIEKGRLEKNILNVIAQEIATIKGISVADAKKSFDYVKIDSYYTLYDPNNVSSDRELAEMQAQFPITKTQYEDGLMAVYIFAPDAAAAELRTIENLVKTYCPLYTYEELEYDHALTEYEASDRAPALFKMALEYTLDELGVTVRLPANGIRFNESEYKLSGITILPYMGAGSNPNTGYTFFPDGSGAIFRFEDLNASRTNQVSGKIYGNDYAYHSITGTHQEVIRYPVYGIVENEIISVTSGSTGEETGTDTTTGTDTGTDTEASGDETTGTGGETTEPGEETTPETVEQIVKKGFVAIIEEGDALTEIQTYHPGATSKYHTVQVIVNPRPRDEYMLSDAVSVGDSKSVTVVSKRKYVGNYKIRYIMLTDDTIASEKNITNYYECTWLGMAHAYQDYLSSPYSTGTQNLSESQQTTVFDRLTSEDIKDDIPLYIETFGAVDSVRKVLSIPINVKVALTSFEDIEQMYTDLSEKGITNINFKLTGYTNGGMYSSVPYRLKFENAVGGKDGFKELLNDAKDKGYGVYVDFDFVYATSSATKMFDGLSYSKDLVKTIDDRYTSKQYYSVTRQSYVSYFELAISPSRYSHFYDKLTENYLEYNPIGISVSTLASELNSDFDEKEPYNREDSKDFTVDLFKTMRNDYSSIMADSANSYTWGYIDHMVNAAVDSSRYIKASNSVPFLGTVLHGYVQFAGTPMNMEGDIGYAVLKSLENGSGIYFMLSYANTQLLKEDTLLSQYYSVRYDIWFEEVVQKYTEINNVLKDLQTKLIINHEFLIGERVPDADEIAADEEAARKKAEEEAAAIIEAERIAHVNAVRAGRYSAYSTAVTQLETMTNLHTTLLSKLSDLLTSIDALKVAQKNSADKKAEVDVAQAAYDAADEESKPALLTELNKLNNELKTLQTAENTAAGVVRTNYRPVEGYTSQIEIVIPAIDSALVNAKIAYEELSTQNYDEAVVTDMKNKLDVVQANSDTIHEIYDDCVAANADAFAKLCEVLPEFIPAEPEDPSEGEGTGEGTGEEGEEEKEEYVYTKYTNDDGNIVAVTYGGKDGNDSSAYRTIILNYNFFDITVKYNDTEYKIPGFGYVVINY